MANVNLITWFLLVTVITTNASFHFANDCVKCRYSVCAPLNTTACQYGSGLDHCGCCKICLKGPGDLCGGFKGRLGKCGRGLECLFERQKGTIRAYGHCVKASLVKCAAVKKCFGCKDKIDCPFGSGKSQCSVNCCNECLKGLGENCGNHHGGYTPCGNGLVCAGEIPSKKSYKPGKCVKIRSSTCYNRPDCRDIKCKKVPEKCRYGVALPPCRCCKVCLQGPGQKCADRHGSYKPCGTNLKCVGENSFTSSDKPYQPGLCVFEAKKCPYKLDCLHGFCHLLPRCKYGIGQPPCSCCPACLKGKDEKCGMKIGYCHPGLYCKGHIIKNNTEIYGQCSPILNSFCFKKQDCSKIKCKPLLNKKCTYGIGKSKCGCCDVCLQGPMQPCGNYHSDYHPCEQHSICQGETMEKGIYQPGKCIPKMDKCPKPVDCAYILPLAKKCHHGSHQPPCACWLQCIKGEGEKCGWVEGRCGKMFYCDGYKYENQKFVPGVCKRIREEKCYRKLNCDFVKCPPTSRRYGCLYGIGRSKCGCCQRCLRGPGESCGDTHGDYRGCGYGLQCKGETVRKGLYIPGKCVHRTKCSHKMNCKNVHCHPLNTKQCKWGAEKPLCACCLKCRKGNNEFCGLKYGVCKKGNLCIGQYRIGDRYIPGRCLKVHKGKIYSKKFFRVYQINHNPSTFYRRKLIQPSIHRRGIFYPNFQRNTHNFRMKPHRNYLNFYYRRHYYPNHTTHTRRYFLVPIRRRNLYKIHEK